jgi:predicted alpha/beta superfamily hydrolase
MKLLNRKSLLFLFAVFFTVSFCSAQFKVHFKVSRFPSYHKAGEPVYLTGNFNNWNPRDEKFRLRTNGAESGITIELPRGMFEYKFTRGSWTEVEAANEGMATENRKINVGRDTNVLVQIDHWADHFPKKPKQSTANKNVQILDSAFFIPQLNRHRRIWIYLPDSYALTRRKYPVVYMHDGQNVFDAATSFSGEWGVDEALDSLGKEVGESIVVAIDNGGDKRLNEYSPFDNPRYGKGEGAAYVDFIVQTLMPFINKHYRTKRSSRFNSIAGSSMGGLISFYAILKYPGKFGAAGVFSPAFWIVPQLKDYALSRAKKVKGKIYFFAGQQESESMVPDMLSVFEIMNQHSKADMKTVIRAEGRHSESTWRNEFPGFYKWLFAGESK